MKTEVKIAKRNRDVGFWFAIITTVILTVNIGANGWLCAFTILWYIAMVFLGSYLQMKIHDAEHDEKDIYDVSDMD